MRLFLAVDLPDSLRRGLGELQRRLRANLTGWRWVRPEGIHLTMRFLGEVAEEEDARQRTAWRLAAGAWRTDWPPPIRLSPLRMSRNRG